MKALFAGILALVVAAPAAALAATYQYVAYTGDVEMVSADNAQEALDLSAENRDRHSGVIIVEDPSDPEIPPSMEVPASGIPAE